MSSPMTIKNNKTLFFIIKSVKRSKIYSHFLTYKNILKATDLMYLDGPSDPILFKLKKEYLADKKIYFLLYKDTVAREG